MDQALLLFAKVPRPGAVKTRLTPVLSPSEAARLYTAFLRDALRQVRPLEVDVHLYFAPPLPEDSLGLPSEVRVHEQEGEGLGPRMRNAFRETLAVGYERGVVMGTDHPTLPTSFLRRAMGSLQTPHAVCVGPSEDGGFYLLGMNAFYSQLFEDMTYSHSRVFADTLARAKRTDARLTVLPEWYDVDTPQDLDRLCSELADGEVDAPNTRRIVEHLDLDARLSEERGEEK